MNIIEEIKRLKLPFGQYVVVGSAAMEARGIRESRDVNIAVLPGLFAHLRETGDWNMTEVGSRVHLLRGNYEVLSDVRIRGYDSTVADLIGSSEVIEGVPFVDLIELRNFKQVRNSRADVADIKLINDYLLHNSK
jgi:hypothetical protein